MDNKVLRIKFMPSKKVGHIALHIFVSWLGCRSFVNWATREGNNDGLRTGTLIHLNV